MLKEKRKFKYIKNKVSKPGKIENVSEVQALIELYEVGVDIMGNKKQPGHEKLMKYQLSIPSILMTNKKAKKAMLFFWRAVYAYWFIEHHSISSRHFILPTLQTVLEYIERLKINEMDKDWNKNSLHWSLNDIENVMNRVWYISDDDKWDDSLDDMWMDKLKTDKQLYEALTKYETELLKWREEQKWKTN